MVGLKIFLLFENVLEMNYEMIRMIFIFLTTYSHTEIFFLGI